MPIAVQERPPMRQYVLATTPGGRTFRWGEDEHAAQNVIEGLQDSDSVPGGHKEASAALSRKSGIDYSDLQRGTKLEIFGAGGYKVSEYRLERAPRTAGDKLLIDPSAVGYQAHLSDDESAAEIFLDSDMGAWGEPSASRRVAPALEKWKINQNAQVQLLPAGTPEIEEPKTFAKVPAISHSWGTMTSSVTEPDVAESWYDSNGIELGEILLAFKNVKGGGGSSWLTAVIAGDDDLPTNYESLEDFNATDGEGAFSIAAGRFFLLLQSFFNGVADGSNGWEQQYRAIKILGRHGLPLQGIYPEVGLLASDVIPYVLERWAPLLNFTTGPYGSIQPTGFPIPQLAFKERTTAKEMIEASLKFELPEWGVWTGQDGPTFHLNQRGEREGRKRWRARVRPAKLEETGQQFDKVRNAMLVSYQDPDGTTRWVGPPGSGANIESERLLDLDPLNPANELGIKRWGRKAMVGRGSPEAAIKAGAAELQKSKELDGSGKATLTGYVEDERGAMWPYYYVHAGDLIEFVDAAIPGDRYIVDAERNRSSRSVSIELDAPPDTTEALAERDNAALVDLGLAN